MAEKLSNLMKIINPCFKKLIEPQAQETRKMTGDITQVVEHLPPKCKALSSNPSQLIFNKIPRPSNEGPVLVAEDGAETTGQIVNLTFISYHIQKLTQMNQDYM
jgi:hypothetical protein